MVSSQPELEQNDALASPLRMRLLLVEANALSERNGTIPTAQASVNADKIAIQRAAIAVNADILGLKNDIAFHPSDESLL